MKEFKCIANIRRHLASHITKERFSNYKIIVSLSILIVISSVCWRAYIMLPIHLAYTSINWQVFTHCFISLIGLLGLLDLLYLIIFILKEKELFDRNVAQSNPFRFGHTILIGISIPCTLYLFQKQSLVLNGILKDFNDTFINPYLNHATSYNILTSFLSLLGILVLSGILVSVIVRYISQKVDRWERGDLSYKMHRNYCVIIGGHDAVPSLTKQLVGKYERIIIYTNRHIPAFRREVESNLQTEEDKQKVIFYYGFRDSIHDLAKLNVNSNNLQSIYILGESRVHGVEETSHDTLNMTCYELVKALRGNVAKSINCYVFFEHLSTSIIFQKYPKDYKYGSLRFIPYNFYDLHAQKLLGWDSLNTQTIRLDRFGTNFIDEDKHVHLIIIGMSRMGLALGLEALRVCHYPNYAKSQNLYEYGDESAKELMDKRRTKITFIDRNMNDEFEFFQRRNSRLLAGVPWHYLDYESPSKSKHHTIDYNRVTLISDIEIEFINARVQSDKVSNYLKAIIDDSSAVVTIASCLTKSDEAIASILCLPDNVLDKAEILVYQPDSSELVKNIIIPNRKDGIKAFGKISESIDIKHLELQECMAKRVNNVYVFKTISDNEGKQSSLQDYTFSQLRDSETKHALICTKSWVEMCEDKRWGNRNHVNAIWQKLHYIDNLDNIKSVITRGITENDGCCNQNDAEGLMVRMEHNRFYIEHLILDREASSGHADKSYYYISNRNKDTKMTPTKDQIMTMAIPYIIQSDSSNEI